MNIRKLNVVFLVIILLFSMGITSPSVQSANQKNDVRGSAPDGEYALEFDENESDHVNCSFNHDLNSNWSIIVEYKSHPHSSNGALVSQYYLGSAISIQADNDIRYSAYHEDGMYSYYHQNVHENNSYTTSAQTVNYTSFTAYYNDEVVHENNSMSMNMTAQTHRNWRIGCKGRGIIDDFYNGTIYEVWIYNIKLNKSQIENRTTTGLTAHYNFEDGTGTTLSDVSGNGHDGTINGATWVETKPEVISTTPTHMADNVKATKNVTVVCNESLNTSYTPTINQTRGDVVAYNFEGFYQTNTPNDTFSWTHNDNWTFEDTINLTIGDYYDTDGFKGDNYTFNFAVEPDPRPEAMLNSPPHKSMDNPLNTTLSVNVSDANGDLMNITFYNNATDDVLGVQNEKSNGTYNITWNNLTVFTNYSWYVTICDGTYNTTNGSWNFTTSHPIPNVKSTTPEGTEISTSTNVKIVFSQSMNTSHTLTLTQKSGSLVNYTLREWTSTNKDNDTVIYTHPNWGNSEKITLAVSDYKTENGTIGSNYTWSFTTEERSLTFTEIVSQFFPLIVLVAMVVVIFTGIVKFMGEDDDYDLYN